MRLRATRQVLAVVAVTTALCADRATQAAPIVRTHVAEMAHRLVMRIARRFRRAVNANLPWQLRAGGIGQLARRPILRPVPVLAAPVPISPFQFRLPPPVA